MRLNKYVNKSIIRKILFLVASVIYIFGIISLCSRIDLDADKANHLLQAEDILSGNFFMSDWELTGVTFFTTDLIYYEIGKIFCGVTPKAIYVAVGLMIASVLIACYFACMIGEEKSLRLKRFLFIALMLIPCRQYIFYFRVHTGAIFLCIIAFLLVYSILKKEELSKRKIYYILLFIVFSFGTIGDMLFVLEGIIPIILVCFFKLLDIDDKEEKKTLYKLIIIAVFAVICAILWDKMFFYIGGANKNNFVEIMKFSKLNEWFSRFQSFLSGIMTLCMGNFWGKQVANIWILIRGINFLIMLIAFILIITNLCRLIKQKIEMLDIMSVLLSCSALMSFLAYILTGMSEVRYITIIPIAGGIVLIRNIDSVINVKNKQICVGLIVILSFLSFIGKIKEISGDMQHTQESDKYELIGFLEEHGLENGYGSFWNASDLTVISENHIKVRHIKADDNNEMQMYKWFAKNEWYSEEAEFVIVDNSKQDGGEGDDFGVSEVNVKNFFGDPFERYEVGNYIVLVYDSDLSQMLLPK